MLRELKGWTQEELARRSGINAKNISLLENDRIDIGKRRAEEFARAFKVHPAIMMRSGWPEEANLPEGCAFAEESSHVHIK